MKRHPLHGPRAYPGEKPGQTVADWLNADTKQNTCCSLSLQLVILSRDHGLSIKNRIIDTPADWMVRYFAEDAKRILSGVWKIESALPPLSAALALYGQELWARVRKCAHCKRFFYARVSRQRFCAKKCQEAHWKSSPRGREYHCTKSKEYRELRKQQHLAANRNDREAFLRILAHRAR